MIRRYLLVAALTCVAILGLETVALGRSGPARVRAAVAWRVSALRGDDAATRGSRPAAPRRVVAAAGGDASAGAAHGGSHGGSHSGHGGAIDWAAVSDRDLDIAAIFLTARDLGVGRALDTLAVLARRDRELWDMGHVITHGLGRFAVARSGGDPSVYAQCNQTFEAGCFHGVMEAYFTSRRAAGPEAIAAAAVNALCASITRPGAPPLAQLECAHGMGHGVTARFGNDIRRALTVCDELTPSDARKECWDGVFMENVVRGTDTPSINIGVSAPAAASADHGMAGMSGMSGGGAPKPARIFLRRDDPAFPCDSVDSKYQPSCWAYQPIVIIIYNKGDVGATLKACDAAPASSVAACYQGAGKQATGWYDKSSDVIDMCRTASPGHADPCYAGAVEAFIDENWSLDSAMAFCARVPDRSKGNCYHYLGTRVGLTSVDSAEAARKCAGAGKEFAVACMEGASGGVGRQALGVRRAASGRG